MVQAANLVFSGRPIFTDESAASVAYNLSTTALSFLSYTVLNSWIARGAHRLSGFRPAWPVFAGITACLACVLALLALAMTGALPIAAWQHGTAALQLLAGCGLLLLLLALLRAGWSRRNRLLLLGFVAYSFVSVLFSAAHHLAHTLGPTESALLANLARAELVLQPIASLAFGLLAYGVSKALPTPPSAA